MKLNSILAFGTAATLAVSGFAAVAPMVKSTVADCNELHNFMVVSCAIPIEIALCIIYKMRYDKCVKNLDNPCPEGWKWLGEDVCIEVDDTPN